MPRPAIIQLTSPGRIGWRTPEAVLVKDLAFEEVGHRGKADMRMRPHVEPASGRQAHRAHLVEEHERADHAALHGRQRAAHLEALAQVARRRRYNRFDGPKIGRHGSLFCAPPGRSVHAIFLPRLVGAFPSVAPGSARMVG